MKECVGASCAQSTSYRGVVPDTEGLTFGEVVERCRADFEEKGRSRGVCSAEYLVSVRAMDSNAYLRVKIEFLKTKVAKEYWVEEVPPLTGDES